MNREAVVRNAEQFLNAVSYTQLYYSMQNDRQSKTTDNAKKNSLGIASSWWLFVVHEADKLPQLLETEENIDKIKPIMDIINDLFKDDEDFYNGVVQDANITTTAGLRRQNIETGLKMFLILKKNIEDFFAGSKEKAPLDFDADISFEVVDDDIDVSQTELPKPHGENTVAEEREENRDEMEEREEMENEEDMEEETGKEKEVEEERGMEEEQRVEEDKRIEEEEQMENSEGLAQENETEEERGIVEERGIEEEEQMEHGEEVEEETEKENEGEIEEEKEIEKEEQIENEEKTEEGTEKKNEEEMEQENRIEKGEQMKNGEQMVKEKENEDEETADNEKEKEKVMAENRTPANAPNVGESNDEDHEDQYEMEYEEVAGAEQPPSTPDAGAEQPPSTPDAGAEQPPSTPDAGAEQPPSTSDAGAEQPPSTPDAGAEQPPSSPDAMDIPLTDYTAENTDERQREYYEGLRPLRIGEIDWLAVFVPGIKLIGRESKQFVETVRNGIEFNKCSEKLGKVYLIEDKEGLGIKIPENFNFETLPEKIKNSRVKTQVINSLTQQAEREMQLQEIAKLFLIKREDRDPTRVINVLSAEFSKMTGTELQRKFVLPKWVEEISVSSQLEKFLKNKKETLKGNQKGIPKNVSRKIMAEKERCKSQFKWLPNTLRFLLLSMENAFTDVHIDFGGTAVFYHVVKGGKVIYLARPTEKNLEIYRQYEMDQSRNKKWIVEELAGEWERVELKEGNTAIIPPGYLHFVFTPEDSIVIGGNFLTIDHVDMHWKIAEMEKEVNNQKAADNQTPVYNGFQFLWWCLLEHVILPELESGTPTSSIKHCGKTLLKKLSCTEEHVKEFNAGKRRELLTKLRTYYPEVPADCLPSTSSTSGPSSSAFPPCYPSSSLSSPVGSSSSGPSSPILPLDERKRLRPESSEFSEGEEPSTSKKAKD